MKSIRFFLFLFLFPFVVHASFTTYDSARSVKHRVESWQKHEELVSRFQSLSLSEQEHNFSLIREAIDRCNDAMDHCKYLAKRIDKKSKTERRNTYWSGERKKCDEDQETIRKQIEFLEQLICHTQREIAFEKARSFYQASEQKAQAARSREEECQRLLGNESEVVKMLEEVEHLYKEAQYLAEEALRAIAAYPEETSVKILHQAALSHRENASQSREAAIGWPAIIREQARALEARLSLLQAPQGAFLFQPSACQISPSEREFREKEKEKREFFFRDPPCLSQVGSLRELDFSFALDGYVARQKEKFTLYQDQFYRFFVSSKTAVSTLSVKVHEQGELVAEEKLTLPAMNTPSWEKYLTKDGMVWIPDTTLKDLFGLDLRLQFVWNPQHPFSAIIASRGRLPQYQFTFSLDESDPVYSCRFYPLPPWQLGRLCKPSLFQNDLFLKMIPSFYSEVSCVPLVKSSERFPLLDQLVEELKRDPFAIASYVHHEIALSDPFLHKERGVFHAPSIHRNALRTYLDKKGSPFEMCELLMYLLHEAGYSAFYAVGGTACLPKSYAETLLFTKVSEEKVLVEYPWVVLCDGDKRIPLFPWMKEFQIDEGFDLYHLLPEEYASAERWMERYLQKDEAIMEGIGPDGEDTAGVLFVRFVEKELRKQGLSLSDVGTQRTVVKKQFSSWSDFPTPWVQMQPSLLLSLEWQDHLFAKVEVVISSHEHPEKKISHKLPLASVGAGSFPIFYPEPNRLRVAFANGCDLSLDLNEEDHLIDVTIHYDLPLGSQFFRTTQSLSMNKGTEAALSFHFGGAAPELTAYLQKEFAKETGEQKRKESLLGFVGASYFDHCGRAEDVLASLHKVRPVSAMAFGLAKLEYSQESVMPQVDMFWFYTHAPFPVDPNRRQYQTLLLLNQSSQEHQILKEVFGDEAAISTVKLLQIAHLDQGFLSFTTPSLSLAKHLPDEAQNLYFPFLKGRNIKESQKHSPSQWEAMHRRLGAQDPLHNWAYAYMTPGVISSENGAHKEVGTLLFHPEASYALISHNHLLAHGGLGSPLPRSLFTSSFIKEWQLVPAINQYGTSSYSLKIPSAPEVLPLFTAKTKWDSDIRLSLKTVWSGVADPVDVVTGAFYIDEVDLVLPGPFPLEIRRNYSSQNPHVGDLGVGWKLSLNPCLVEQEGKLYAAEMDGTVLAYQYNPAEDRWVVSREDNPDLYNFNRSGTNPFQAYIENDILYGADGSKRVFEKGLLKTWTNYRGNTLTFFYTDEKLSRIESSNGDFCGLHYNQEGKISEIYAKDGRRIYYQYDSCGNLSRVILPNTAVISYEYDSEHQMIRETKPHGNVIENVYCDGKVVEQRSPMGLGQSMIPTARFEYKEGVTFVTDAAHGKTTYKIFEKQIYQIIDPLGYPTLQSWFCDEESWFDPVTEKIVPWEYAGGFSRSLKSSTDKRGLSTHYVYDAHGNPITIVLEGKDLTGSGISHMTKYLTYNENHLCILERVLDHTTEVTYDGYLPTSMTRFCNDAVLSSIKWEYDSLGQMIKADNSGSVTLFAYDDRGFLSQKIEVTGTSDPDVITTYSYSPQGQCILIQSPDALEVNEYDMMGNRVESKLYSLSGELLSTCCTGYNLNHSPLFQKRANLENTTYFDYTASNRLKAFWQKDAYTLYEYDARGYLIEEVDPCGNSIERAYDQLGRVISETKGGLSTCFTYEPGGLVATMTSPLGAKTTFSYTTNGLLTQKIYPDGTIDSIVYDILGRVIRETKNKITYEMTYEGNRLIRTHGSISEISEYDARGNLICFTDAAGCTSTKTYDGLNRIISHISPSGETTVWHYDNNTITTLFPSQEKQIQRHEGGRIVESILLSGSNQILSTSRLHCDPEQEIEQVSQGDITTTTWLNAQGKPIKVEKGGFLTFYDYDRCGNCVAITDGDGKTTHQTFDALHRLTQKELSDGSLITYIYDPDSNLIEYHLPNNTCWKASYDCMGRKLTEWLESEGKISQHWEYEYTDGFLTASKDPLERLHLYNYDVEGNLIQERVDGYERLFAYDSRGLLVSAEQIEPSHSFWWFKEGSKIERAYDEDGRLVAETIFLNSNPIQQTKQEWTPSTRSLQVNDHTRHFLYANHKLIRVSTPQVALDYAYNLAGSLESASTPFTFTQHFYNAAGLPSTILTTLPGASFQATLSWTSSGKLASYSSPSYQDQFSYTDRGYLDATQSESYAFDFAMPGVGVRTKGPHHTVSELDAFGKVVTELIDNQQITTTYDEMGQVLSQGLKRFEWDPWGRLRKISDESFSWTASYDILGRRLQTQYTTGWFSTETTTYFYDPETEFQAIGVESGGHLSWKLYGPVSCDAILESTGQTILLHNPLGHLTHKISPGTTETLPPISPYGPSTDTLWHSQSLDQTGLIWLGERYYDPRTARFLSSDPLGYPPCLDLYAYANGDPINYTDLDGRFASAAYSTIFYQKPLRVAGFNHFIARNYLRTDSIPFSVGSFDLPKGAIGFINGINTSLSNARGHGEYLSQFAQGAKIHGVYNATHSLPLDLLEARLVQCGYNTPPVYRIKEQWDQFIATQGPDAKFLQICHSGGCGIVRNALQASPKEVRDRIIVLAIAPSVIIPRDLCYESSNYVSRQDGVPFLDRHGLILHGKELQILPAAPGAKIWDHEFQSPTFASKIREHIEDYIEGGGIR